MAGNGDIGDVGGVADTISSPPGTVVKPPSLVAWTNGTPTLGVGSIAAPVKQGGLNADAPTPTDPDRLAGSFSLSNVSPTLGLASTATPTGKADVGDVYGSPDTAVQAPVNFKVAGLVAFSSVGPTLATGSHAAPPEHGDIGDVGMSPTPKNEWNDSAAGMGTLTSWSTAVGSLTVGTLPAVAEHGDVGDMYGNGQSNIIQQLVWNDVTPTLATASLPAMHGQGGITNDALSLGYGPSTYVWVANPEPPVLAVATSDGINHLTWTSWPPTAPAIPNITYTVYRAVLGGGFSVLASGLTSPAYNDSTMVRGVSYQYFVDPVIPDTNVGTFASNVVTVIWGFTNVYNAPGTYTWTGAPNALIYDIFVVGAGGGGSCGAERTIGTAPGGEAGAGGGVAHHATVNPALITPTVTVTVGAGGVGSSGGSGDGQVGGGSTFGSYFTANGGQGGPSNGAGGHATGGVATSTIAGATLLTGGSGGDTNVSGVNPPVVPPSTNGAPSGGGSAGASNNGGNPVVNGSNGGAVTSPVLAGGVGGQSFAIPGFTPGIILRALPGTVGNTAGLSVGSGGGGGGFALLQDDLPGCEVFGGDGGDGGLYGAGGGGGGSAVGAAGGTQTSGKGGNGAPGLVVATVYMW